MTALIIQLLLPVIGMILLYAFMAQAVPLRKRWPLRISAVLVLSLITAAVKIHWGMFSPQSYWIRLVGLPIMSVIAPLLIFQGPVWKRLLVNALLYCSQMLGEAVCVQMMVPIGAAGNVDAYYAQMSVSQLLLYAALSQGSSIILYTAITILARNLTARRFSFIYLPVLLFPLSLWGMMMAHFLSFGTWIWFVCIFLGGGGTVILLYYIISLEEKEALKEQIRALRHAIELEQAHYRTVEERREELARIRHDFNNHLSAIGRLIAGGEMEDAQQMLARLSEDVASTREMHYCSIPVVNAVLDEKAQICREKGIGLRVTLELPEELAVEPLHLCSIFANLMDNAIRGAEASGADRPEVTLTAKSGGDYLFIKTANPCSEHCLQGDTLTGQGLGLRICNEIAGRYGGAYQSTVEDGVYTALVSLLFC